MNIIKDTDYRRYFFILLMLGILFLTYLVLKPFLTAILGSFIIAFIFYPAYVFTNKRIKNTNISALLVTLLIILLVTLPVLFFANIMINEANQFASAVKHIIKSDTLLPALCGQQNTTVCSMIDSAKTFVAYDDSKVDIWLENLRVWLLTTVTEIIMTIPKIALDIFVMIFLIFYLFKEGPMLVNIIMNLLPIDKKYHKKMVKQFGDVTRGVIYGWIIVGIIQGIAGAIGFFIFGIRSPIMWGVVMAFAALLPLVGCAIIWFPAAILKIAEGVSLNSSDVTWKGIGLMFYGILIISTIDNLIRPKVMGDQAKMHPVLILLGVMGGIALLGIVGAIIGPLLLILLVTFLEIYEKEKE